MAGLKEKMVDNLVKELQAIRKIAGKNVVVRLTYEGCWDSIDNVYLYGDTICIGQATTDNEAKGLNITHCCQICGRPTNVGVDNPWEVFPPCKKCVEFNLACVEWNSM